MRTLRYFAPLDPECPQVELFHEMLQNDPITAHCGCIDDVIEGFETNHRIKCNRCQQYGCANIEVD